MTYLPEVTFETLESALNSMSHGGVDWQVERYLQIKEEQPMLWECLQYVILDVDNLKTDDYKDGYCKAAAQFYDLLRRQAEAEDLEDQWGL